MLCHMLILFEIKNLINMLKIYYSLYTEKNMSYAVGNNIVTKFLMDNSS